MMARPPFFASLPSGSRSRDGTDSAPGRAAPLSPESSPGPVGSAPALPHDPCPVCPSASPTEPIALVEDLRREVDELRARVHRLERENLELRQQLGYWK